MPTKCINMLYASFPTLKRKGSRYYKSLLLLKSLEVMLQVVVFFPHVRETLSLHGVYPRTDSYTD